MKKCLIKKFSISIAGFILLGFAAVPYSAFSAEKLIGLYASPAISNSLPWIAQETGLFSRYNLNFQFIYITTAQLMPALMLRGDGEVALGGGASFVRAYVQGANDLVIIGGIKNVLTHSILAGPEITKPEDLRGKKIGVARIGSNPHYFAIQALRRFGLDPARDNIVFIQTGEASGTLAALAGGGVHAGTLTAPMDAKAIAQGFHYVVYGPDLRIPYANTFFATRRSLMAKRSQVVEQFMRAMAEAAKILHTDKELTYKVLGKHYKVEDRKILDAAYNPEIKVLEPRLDIKPEGLQAALDEVSQIDPRARKIKPQDLMDIRYLDEMGKTGFFDKLWLGDRSR